MQLVAVIETIDHPTKAHTLLLCGAEKRRLRSCVAARDLGCVCARTHAREDKKIRIQAPARRMKAKDDKQGQEGAPRRQAGRRALATAARPRPSSCAVFRNTSTCDVACGRCK